jgi:hypothetical protein
MLFPINADLDGMQDRREPRFQIYAPAKITLVDDPARELNCLLLDVSATGMKIVADENLPADELIAIEVEDHIVLADVRYSQPRGEKFAIGAERIHAVPKSSAPLDQAKTEQIRFVIADYRSRIKASIAADSGAPARDEMPAAGEPPVEYVAQHRDRLMEAAVRELVEQWSKDSGGAEAMATLHAAIVDSQGRATQATVHSVPPEPMRMETPPRPSRRLPWGLAAAAAVAVFAVSAFWSYRSANSSVHPAVSVAPARAASSAQQVSPPAGTLRSTSGNRRAEIHVVEPAWVSATSDGKELFEKLLAKDETRQIEFAEKALVRVGNAGGVEITVDGKPIGPLGPHGKIRALEITPGGYRFVPVADPLQGNN